MIKVIAFDVFGTVFDLSSVPRQEIKDYADHIRKPEWSPLVLPKSWERLKAHYDSRLAIEELRLHYTVVTMSNGPVDLLTKLSRFNRIDWDLIVPIEMKKVFKPNREAYKTILDIYNVNASEILMVTANEHFGDLEATAKLGMNSTLIDRSAGRDIANLAEELSMGRL